MNPLDRPRITILILAALIFLPVHAGVAQTLSPSPTPKADPPEPVDATMGRDTPSYRGLFRSQVRISNTYSSNIDHDDDPIQSFGLVPSLHVRFQDHRTDPILMIDYAAAKHSYTNTERWDRLSHAARIEFAPALSHAVRLSTVVETSLRGSSEDGDLSDQYRITQEVEFRLTRNNRVQVYGALRWKRFDDDDELDSFKPHVGIRLDTRLPGNRRWKVGARYERNEARSSRRNYTRWTFDTKFRFPVSGSRNDVEFGVKFRTKEFDEQSVEIEDREVVRSDQRWIADVSWKHRLGLGLSVELDYRFETRDSNDPDKLYDAHQLGFSVAYDL